MGVGGDAGRLQYDGGRGRGKRQHDLPEHLADYPNLHELFWNANKLAGANKQGVSSESAQQLVDAVDEIAKIFWASKGVDYSDPNAAVRYGA